MENQQLIQRGSSDNSNDSYDYFVEKCWNCGFKLYCIHCNQSLFKASSKVSSIANNTPQCCKSCTCPGPCLQNSQVIKNQTQKPDNQMLDQKQESKNNQPIKNKMQQQPETSQVASQQLQKMKKLKKISLKSNNSQYIDEMSESSGPPLIGIVLRNKKVVVFSENT